MQAIRTRFADLSNFQKPSELATDNKKTEGRDINLKFHLRTRKQRIEYACDNITTSSIKSVVKYKEKDTRKIITNVINVNSATGRHILKIQT